MARRQNKKSKRRRKAILLLQKAYQHVANQRKDFQHKLSTQLVQNFGMIAVEDLNIKSLSAGILAKAVHDVGWSTFLNMLAYKAENDGRQVVKVDPKYTSQECPNCHALEKKPLSERVHRCDCAGPGASTKTASRPELGTRDLAQCLARLFRDGRFWINTDRLFELRAGPGSVV